MARVTNKCIVALVILFLVGCSGDLTATAEEKLRAVEDSYFSGDMSDTETLCRLHLDWIDSRFDRIEDVRRHLSVCYGALIIIYASKGEVTSTSVLLNDYMEAIRRTGITPPDDSKQKMSNFLTLMSRCEPIPNWFDADHFNRTLSSVIASYVAKESSMENYK